ncbi:MAG: TetR/AcrR family transcriptional regulator [Planctomycetes bacterium]|nr:TetR/AcrR family transcriptional regulator [Planctomycetota bacterium]
MGTVERRAREKDAKRRAIVRAAIKCFAKKGYDGTTLDEVGALAEVAKGTLYLYFKSKADLFAALLLEHGFDVFTRALEGTFRAGRTPSSTLFDFSRSFRELCLEGRSEIFDFFLQLDRGDISRDLSPELRAEARRRLEDVLARIASVVDEARTKNDLVGPEGRRVALILWAFCVGIAHLVKGGYSEAAGVLNDGVSILYNGLSPARK